jgi:hypothetical protein
MRTVLAEDPAVITIAAALGVEEDAVVGKLHRMWSWADRQTVDGNAPGVTAAWLDRHLGVTGFAQAAAAAGWLEVTAAGIRFPKWDRHNSQSAKQRVLTAKRVATHRGRAGNGDSVTDALPREEKRREDSTPPTPSGGADEHFNAFWAAYPKKEKKAGALKAWRKLKPDRKLSGQIMSALDAHKAREEWCRDGGKYVPHPTSWLNQRRWEDEGVAAVGPLPAPARSSEAVLAEQRRRVDEGRAREKAAVTGGQMGLFLSGGGEL